MKKALSFIILFLLYINLAFAYTFTDDELKLINNSVNKYENDISKKGESQRSVILKALDKLKNTYETSDEKKYWMIKEIIKNLTEENLGEYKAPNGKKVILLKLRDKYRYLADSKKSTLFDTKDLMLAHLDRKYAADNIVENYKLDGITYKIVKKESLYFYRDEKGDLVNKSFSTIEDLKKYLKKQLALKKIDNSNVGSSETNSKLVKHIKDSESKSVYYLKGNSKIALSGVDFSSFKEMKANPDFGMDRNTVYYKGNKTKITDTPTFTILSAGYVKDKNIVLYCNDIKCLEVPGADPMTFEVLSNGIGSDKNRQYNKNVPNGN